MVIGVSVTIERRKFATILLVLFTNACTPSLSNSLSSGVDTLDVTRTLGTRIINSDELGELDGASDADGA